MYKILVSLLSILWVIAPSVTAQAAERLDSNAEAEFCSILENKPVFSSVSQFAKEHGTSIEDIFLTTICPNNSKIVEIANMKTTYPLVLVVSDPTNNMIFFEELVKYFELEKKLDSYKAIMNRKDPSSRTTLDIIEEQIAAVIKEGTNRALLNMQGFMRADMCYRGGEHTLEASAKICDNYPTKIYAWCVETFDSNNLGLCLGYRGRIPPKFMMMLTGKCIKLRDKKEELEACLKPFQYSNKG